jgi:hypothetical protein
LARALSCRDKNPPRSNLTSTLTTNSRHDFVAYEKQAKMEAGGCSASAISAFENTFNVSPSAIKRRVTSERVSVG